MNTTTLLPLPLLTLAVASTAAAGLAWITAFFLRRKSAALRHLLWLLALSAPLLALLLAWPRVPRIPLPILPPSHEQMPAYQSSSENQDAILPSSAPVVVEHTAADTSAPGPAPQPTRQHKFDMPLNPWWAVWLAGAVLVMIRIGNAHLRAKRLLRTGCFLGTGELRLHLDAARKSFRLARPVRLMVTPLVEIPFCNGILRPAVIFPESWREWDDERVDICMAHEMAHIIRRDLLSMLAGQVACSLCWFNPLIWLAAAKLRDEAEIAADDMVLARDIRPETYATTLLAITEKCRVPAFPPATTLSMARPGRLKTRIVSILDSSLQRKSPGARAILALSLLTAFAVVSTVNIRLTAAQPLEEKSPASSEAGETMLVAQATPPEASASNQAPVTASTPGSSPQQSAPPNQVDEAMAKHALECIGLDQAGVIVDQTESKSEDHFLPFQKKQDTILRIHVENFKLAVKDGNRTVTNTYIHSLNIYYSKNAGQVVEILSDLQKGVKVEPFPPVRDQEKALKEQEQSYAWVPLPTPRVKLMKALASTDRVSQAKQIMVYYTRAWAPDYNKANPLWEIYERGLPGTPIDPPPRLGYPAGKVITPSEDEWCEPINAMTGKKETYGTAPF